MTDSEHVPAPSGHAPRVETIIDSDNPGAIIVQERDSDSAWVRCESPVEVEQ